MSHSMKGRRKRTFSAGFHFDGRTPFSQFYADWLPRDDYQAVVLDWFSAENALLNGKLVVSIPGLDKSAIAGDSAEAILVDRIDLIPVPQKWPRRASRLSSVASSDNPPHAWLAIEDQLFMLFQSDSKTHHWSNSLAGEILGLSKIQTVVAGNRWVFAGTLDGVVHAFDVVTGKPAFSSKRLKSGISALAVNRAEDSIVVGTQAGKLHVFTVPKFKNVRTLPDQIGSVRSLSVGADGRLLVTAAEDQLIHLWKRTGEKFERMISLPSPTGRVRKVQLDSPGRILAALVDGESAVRIWNIKQLQNACFDLVGHIP